MLQDVRCSYVLYTVACDLVFDVTVWPFVWPHFNTTTHYTLYIIHYTLYIHYTLCKVRFVYLLCPIVYLPYNAMWSVLTIGWGLLQDCFSALTCLGHLVEHMMRKFVRNCVLHFHQWFTIHARYTQTYIYRTQYRIQYRTHVEEIWEKLWKCVFWGCFHHGLHYMPETLYMLIITTNPRIDISCLNVT